MLPPRSREKVPISGRKASNSHVFKSLFSSHLRITNKMKVVPYTFVRRGVPVREDTYPEPEVGWPVLFLVAFISPVFPLGTHLLVGEQ